MTATLPVTRAQAARRRRVAVIGIFAVVGIGGGYALASGSGADSTPAAQPVVAPNGGSAGGQPQREVAVQPQLAPPKK